MSQLLLVRHGQASFGAADYDALSALGHEQSRLLGAVLRERGVVPETLLRGAMRRHDETAVGLLAGRGDQVPVQVDPGWDEFDFQHLLEVHGGSSNIADPRAFQQLLEAATDRWTSGANDEEYAESFPAFVHRVEGALERARALLAGARTVVVVTSGGPIALAAALLVGGSADVRTLGRWWGALNRVTVNTGVTKVLAGRRGLTLSTYNEHAHLEADARLLTYR